LASNWTVSPYLLASSLKNLLLRFNFFTIGNAGGGVVVTSWSPLLALFVIFARLFPLTGRFYVE
jgi:hypothetical protein